jgi:uncharacterized protein (DUF362 family)
MHNTVDTHPGAGCPSGSGLTRRGFLRGAAGAAVGGWAALYAGPGRTQAPPATEPVRVALTHGDSRADNVYQALKLIEPQVRAGLAGKKRIIIKPNLVNTERQLCSSHVDGVEGILEFLRPLFPGDIAVAETSANAATAEGYDHFGYGRIEARYGVKLLDLDALPFGIQHVIDERYRAVPIRFSKFLLDPEAYVISTAPMKTHDRVVATLGLKNLAVGGILKDPGFRWGAGSVGTTDKHLVHGGPKNEGIHYNLFSLAKLLHPHLTVLDGFESMEHNGPVSGTPLEHRIAVASADWLAADRAGIELMGFDFNKVGYLTFCAKAGMGQADLAKVEVLGERIVDHIRRYQPHDAVEEQYQWLQ